MPRKGFLTRFSENFSPSSECWWNIFALHLLEEELKVKCSLTVSVLLKKHCCIVSDNTSPALLYVLFISRIVDDHRPLESVFEEFLLNDSISDQFWKDSKRLRLF